MQHFRIDLRRSNSLHDDIIDNKLVADTSMMYIPSSVKILQLV
jgi:hypothetical protein